MGQGARAASKLDGAEMPTFLVVLSSTVIAILAFPFSLAILAMMVLSTAVATAADWLRGLLQRAPWRVRKNLVPSPSEPPGAGPE
ncbi:MAG TPA: hypothetical protein VF342_13865 [Alphaproteobacteria bacterium]